MFWNEFEKYQERPALVEGPRVVTYTELDRLCSDFSSRLVREKSLVLIESDNSVESITAFYGALRKGHAAVFCEKGNRRLKENLEAAFSPRYCYEEGNDGWQLRVNDGEDGQVLHENLALLICTSGSTGSPKCARISWENITANTASIVSFLEISEDDRCLLLLPAFYCYGLSIINTHLASGACLHVRGPSAESCGFVPYLKDHEITSFSGVPHTFEMLERTGFRRERFSRLRCIAQAGGRLREKLVADYGRWARLNTTSFFVMYGQAEATARIAYLPASMVEEHPDCIGFPVPGGKVTIVDHNDKEITAPGRQGELVYEGPNVMMGYASSQEDLPAGREISCLKTGDVAEKTADGLLRITGRLRRFCKIYGRRCNLDEMETVLRVVDPTVACVSDDDKLFVVSERNRDTELVEIIGKQFGIAPIQILTHHYDETPLLGSGKIDYEQIQCDFRQQRSVTEKDPDQPARERLIALFSRVFPAAGISGRDSFFALGGDSLSYVAASMDIERVLGRLPAGWERMSINELAEMKVQQERSARGTVETGIVLRALAILFIVLQHNDLFLGGGAVILMLVAGRNFSRFHLENIAGGRILPMCSSVITNILIPYWLILIGWNLTRYLYRGEHAASLSKFLLAGNYFYQVDWWPFPTWFVQVLIHAIAVVSVPLLFVSIRRMVKERLQLYLLLLLAAALGYRFLDGALLMELFPTRFADQRTAWELWIFLFGMCIYYLDSDRQRLYCSLALPVCTLLFWHGFWSRTVALCLGGLLLIWKDDLQVPRMLMSSIKILGSASLYIYMTHLIGFTPAFDLLGPPGRALVGIVQGVLFWLIFRILEKRVRKGWDRLLSNPRRSEN